MTRSSLFWVLLSACPIPAATDAGVDSGTAEWCWAPTGTVFATDEFTPTTLATSVLHESGPCFSTSTRYQLRNPLDGGQIDLINADGHLQTPPGIRGIFNIEVQAHNTWLGLRQLYFARPARGWSLARTCLRGEPIGDAFSCDGRIHFSDGGLGPVADDWLSNRGFVYALRDGGIVAGRSPATVTPFAAQPEDIAFWHGDVDGLSTLSAQNVIRLFAPDGGQTEVALPQDAGMSSVFRASGRTYFSRTSYRFGGELCAIDAIGDDAGCEPGYLFATSGELAWGTGATSGGDWYAIAYVFDGGWVDEPRWLFIAPSGWGPRSGTFRSIQGGLVVVEPTETRVLISQGVRDGQHDLILFELDSPRVASGVRSSVAWVSWDGGTLVAR